MQLYQSSQTNQIVSYSTIHLINHAIVTGVHIYNVLFSLDVFVHSVIINNLLLHPNQDKQSKYILSIMKQNHPLN